MCKFRVNLHAPLILIKVIRVTLNNLETQKSAAKVLLASDAAKRICTLDFSTHIDSAKAPRICTPTFLLRGVLCPPEVKSTSFYAFRDAAII